MLNSTNNDGFQKALYIFVVLIIFSFTATHFFLRSYSKPQSLLMSFCVKREQNKYNQINNI